MDRKEKIEARGAALLGAAVLITIPLAAVWSRAAVADGVLTFWITASILALFKADLAGADIPDSRSPTVRNWYLIASICAGMAFLDKGPVGLAVPFITWLLYHIRQSDLKRAAKQMPWLAGIALFIIIAAPWYAATYFVDGPGFLKWFFLRENVERYTSTMHGWGGKLPFCLIWYPAVSLILAFPLSAYLVSDLIQPFAGNQDIARQYNLLRLRRFSWSWILAVIAIFTASRTQFPHYIHSILGAVGILFALHVYARFGSRTEQSKTVSKASRITETVILVLLGVGLIGYLARALTIGHGKPGRIAEWPYPEPAATILAVLLGAALLVFLYGIRLLGKKGSEERGLQTNLAAWVSVMAVLILGVGPFYVRSVYGPTAAMGCFLRSIPQGEPVITYLREAPEGLVFYSHHRIEFFARKHGDTKPLKDVTAIIRRVGSAVVITDESGIEELKGIGAPVKLKTIDKTMAVRMMAE